MSQSLAWGSKVSAGFRSALLSIAREISVDASDLMSCIAFETGESFSPGIRNSAGSGAVGLIQFMPQTAQALGTSTQDLATMTPEVQLMYVRNYFRPRAGKLRNLGDLYCAILWPAGIGKPDDWVMFDKVDPAHPKLYVQNAGLDFNHDGKITRIEACRRVAEKRAKGLQPPFVSLLP